MPKIKITEQILKDAINKNKNPNFANVIEFALIREQREIDGHIIEELFVDTGHPNFELAKKLPQIVPSKGLGDIVKKVADMTGISKAAQLLERITKKPCGCKNRQNKLNELVPYKEKTPPILDGLEEMKMVEEVKIS